MTGNCWRSVDIHFRAVAGIVLLSHLPIEEANTSFMTVWNLSPCWQPRIHDQEMLTLRWHSFSWWGKEHFPVYFAYKGSQYFIYDYLQPIANKILQDTWPRIVDPPLTHILPPVYPQYAIIWFCVVHHSHWFGSLSSIFIYFLLDHYIVCY
jgi:hypothetical protein